MNNSLGDKIRELRKRKHMTQEELADGICTSVSISRIENGIQMPSSTILERILDRLGTSTYEICNIYYKNEQQKEFEEISKSVADLLSSGNISKAKREIKKLKAFGNEDAFSQQMILFLEGTVLIHEASEESRIMLECAIKKTKPNIDLGDFRESLLSTTEANIISVLSAAYYKSGDVRKAIRMGEELFSSMNKHESQVKNYNVILINTAMNLSNYLVVENRIKEALEYIVQAEEISIKASETSLLPEIEFMKAKILFSLGMKKESKEIVTAVYPYMKLIKKDQFAEITYQFATEKLKMKL
ncbi:MAG: helix-turn-helix transcriptional regulator [Lachnospiraceae bacterium]|nr:helix-turn-helix transcriptional regulator [Lachnospiraceae bacterium]